MRCVPGAHGCRLFRFLETFFEARPSAHVSGVRVLSTLGLFGEIPSSGCARNKSRWDAAVAAVYFRDAESTFENLILEYTPSKKGFIGVKDTRHTSSRFR